MVSTDRNTGQTEVCAPCFQVYGLLGASVLVFWTMKPTTTSIFQDSKGFEAAGRHWGQRQISSESFVKRDGPSQLVEWWNEVWYNQSCSEVIGLCPTYQFTIQVTSTIILLHAHKCHVVSTVITVVSPTCEACKKKSMLRIAQVWNPIFICVPQIIEKSAFFLSN